MNISVSKCHDRGHATIQPEQVIDLALKSERLMSDDLEQKHIGTPLTEHQSAALYERGREVVKVRLHCSLTTKTRSYTIAEY
jgi:hypothetical protein